MEVIAPLVFLDTCQLDSSENLAVSTLDEYLPIIGEDYFLPKEQSEDYIELPILHELGRFYTLEIIEDYCSSLKIVRPELWPPGTPPPTRTPS